MSDWRLEAEAWSHTEAFARHVTTAQRVIERACAVGPASFAISLGKDSTALAGLAVEILGGVARLMHLHSPYAIPGGEAVLEWFASRARVEVLESPKTLAEHVAYLRKIGLGYERAGGHAKAARRKSDRATDWAEANGIKVQCLGLRAEESSRRRLALRRTGMLYQRADGMWIGWPIGHWTTRDVWAFIHSRGLPYHPLYDRETHGYTRATLRNGGWLTTIDIRRIPWLRAHYPEQWRMLTDAFPRVRMLS